MKHYFRILLSLTMLMGNIAIAGHHEAEEKKTEGMIKGSAQAYIISPKDGDSVTSPVLVIFGLKGMGIAPAGVDRENTGHHHLIIDADLPAKNMPIPSNANYRHFGKGQTEANIELEPGEHTLQLLIGDYGHMQHAVPVASEKITIIVE